MQKLNVALLSGGISSEREVSLHSGEQVYEALDKAKYNILRYDPQSDLARLVQDAPQIDIAMIILHGPFGEDGTVQGLLDLLNIPYQGSGVLGSALAMNKAATKQLYEKAGLPMIPYMVYGRDETVDVDKCTARLGLPLVPNIKLAHSTPQPTPPENTSTRNFRSTARVRNSTKRG